FAPRFDYAASRARLTPRWHGVLATDDEDEVITLAAPRDLWWRLEDDTAIVALKLGEGEQAWFVLRYDDDEVCPVESYESERPLKETIDFWDGWTAKIQYVGPHRGAVERSALVLKLMCFQPTG